MNTISFEDDLLHLFVSHPEGICHSIFKNYIKADSILDSLFITIVTSILENKTDPQDIFSKCLICGNYNDLTYLDHFSMKNGIKIKDKTTVVRSSCKESNQPCQFEYAITFPVSFSNRPPLHTAYNMSLSCFKSYSLEQFLKKVKDKF